MIETHRLILREMNDQDGEYIVQWRNDPYINKWMFDQQKITLKSHNDWFRTKDRDIRIDYIIEDRSTGNPIGTLNFKNLESGKAEAGKMLGNREYWGKGFAKEAFGAWVDFGFNVLQLKEIYIYTQSENVGNIALNSKLGFVKSEEIKSNNAEQGLEFIKMTLSLSDFQKLKNK